MKCGRAEAWVSDAVEEKGLAREGGTLGNTEQGMHPGGWAMERPTSDVGIFPGQCGSQKYELMDRVSSESSRAYCH